MQTPLLCDKDTCVLPAAQVAMTLQPLMTYTHRVVGYEAKCSMPWEGFSAGACRPETSADGTVADQSLALQADEVPTCFCIPYLMDAAACQMLFPKGSLLFFHLPPAADDKRLLEYCSALIALGFSLGIADYKGEPIWDAVLPLVTHIWLRNPRSLTPRQRQVLSSSLRKKVSFVASNIETQTDLVEAMRDGFQLFQGSFACRISRLHWPEEEMLERILLLARMCQAVEVTSALLTDFLGQPNLLHRFDNLLRRAVPNLRASTQNPDNLFAELGAKCTLRYMQISFMWDVTGSSAPVLIRSLFQTARFHELMRTAALGFASPTACFEGLMLGLLRAVEDGKISGERSLESVSTLLKDRLGIPMNCSAFLKNHKIANAYNEGRWDDVEKGCRDDGYALADVNRMFHEAGMWAHEYTKIDR